MTEHSIRLHEMHRKPSTVSPAERAAMRRTWLALECEAKILRRENDIAGADAVMRMAKAFRKLCRPGHVSLATCENDLLQWELRLHALNDH
jgi:hypothetical protein